jgi:hypothetical protein
MRVRTTVDQVAVVGGKRYDQPMGIVVEEKTSRFARGRDRGNLYVLADVSGPVAGRDIIAGQLAGIVRDAYYNRQGSITAGLQQALRQANNLLYDENRNSLPSDRRTAGLSCVVLRDMELFVAQVGPTAVFLADDGSVTRYPDVSPWLDDLPPEETDAAALGERRDVNVALFHAQIGSGSVILLVEGDLVRGIASQAWPDILSHASTREILDALLEKSQGRDMSALVVAMDEGTGKVVAEPSPVPSAADRAPRPAPQALGGQASLWISQLKVGERLRTAGQVLVATLAGLWLALLALLKRLMPSPGPPQETVERQTTAVKKAKPKPTRRPRRQGAQKAKSEAVQKLLIGVAVALPLVILVVVSIIVIQRGQSKRAELDALWQDANNAWTQAQTTSDPAAARNLLDSAIASLDELLGLKSDYPGAQDLRKKVEARLDLINRVQRISWIAALKDYPAGANLSRVVVRGVHVFVMDRNNNQVYHHELDETQKALKADASDPVLLRKGEQVGNALVGDLVDMVWMPAGPGRQKEALVILESGGTLIEYDPTTAELVPLKVAGADTWAYPELVGSYYGRFYVLDSTANKIWRYQPTADGYSTLPDDWLQTAVDLAGATDMAIGDSIYLVYADGKIQRLTAGEPDAFDTADWDMDPRNPTAIFTRPPEETRAVYVADPGNSRIVQCGKEGKFERQFRLADPEIADGSDPLAGVTSLFVDESIGHAYFLSGQKLYLIILPN